MPTPRAHIEAKVVKILSDITRLPLDEFTADASLASLGIESLDQISICIEVESEFNVILTDEDMMKLETVGDIFGLVERLEIGN